MLALSRDPSSVPQPAMLLNAHATLEMLSPFKDACDTHALPAVQLF